MDIAQLLDKDIIKKYKLLTKIASKNEMSFSQKELEQYINVTRNTLLRIVAEIQSDIKFYGYEHFMSLNFDNLKKSYSLTLASGFSIDIISLHYFKNSIRFRLIEELFYGDLESVAVTSERYYISEITLRRILKELIDFLRVWGINLTTRSNICLVGDEALIQSFYVYVFFHIYGGISWPFKNFEEQQIASYTATCLSHMFKIESIENRILINYIISVSIERSKNKKVYLRSEKYLYFDNSAKYEVGKNAAVLVLSRYLPKKNSKELEIEFQLHCSLLIINEVVDCIPRLPNLFFLSNLKEQHLITNSMLLISIVEIYLDKPLSSESYSTLLNRICLSHYSAFFLYDAINIVPKKWIINEKYNIGSRHPLFNKTQDDYMQVMETKNFDELLFFNHFLQVRDVGIFFKLIPDEFHKKKIKICMKTSHEVIIKKEILHNFSSSFDISFCNFDNFDVCIVTDERYMVYNSKNNKNYCTFLWNPVTKLEITLEIFKVFLSELFK